jgi:hypothetical protein
VYREVMDGRAQIGVVGCVSVADYERDVIRKHERTRPDKEDDRTRHILTLEAHAEPVLFAYRGSTEVDRLVAAAVKAPALYDLTTADGVRHTVWKAPDAAALVDAVRARALCLRRRRPPPLGGGAAGGDRAPRPGPARDGRGVRVVPRGPLPRGSARDPVVPSPGPLISVA